jgi:hypothetical protein
VEVFWGDDSPSRFLFLISAPSLSSLLCNFRQIFHHPSSPAVEYCSSIFLVSVSLLLHRGLSTTIQQQAQLFTLPANFNLECARTTHLVWNVQKREILGFNSIGRNTMHLYLSYLKPTLMKNRHHWNFVL